MKSRAKSPARPAALPDTEKITINLGFVDLGQIDLLVAESFYSNRSDFIRTAIRTHLAGHADVVRQVVTRKTLVLGLQVFTREALEQALAFGQRLDIRVLGLAVIAADVDVVLALAAISSIEVLGALHASPAVESALLNRPR
jgi:Arc/MetJ-type ribon-helix-helix transcriptional regulator